MKSTKKRLLEFLTYLDIGQNAFEKKAGIANGYISHNKGSIGSETISKISNAYPELNTEWLLFGIGDMLKSNNETSEFKGKFVPLIPIDAVAGFPVEYYDDVLSADYEQYYVPDFKMRGVEFVIRVSGSSMYPKYSSGDVLACKKVNDILFFQWGKVYVIDSSQGSLVKRIFEDRENPENLLLVSDNKENYPAFSIPKSDIRSLSIVLGVIRME